MKHITVIGGGGTGITMAADLTLKGFPVTLYERADAWDNLRDIQERGGVEMTGRAANGFAALTDLTDDLAQAVSKADVILVAVIATRHQALAEELAPLLRDGQTVCFSAGSCASILLRRAVGGRCQVVIGEMQGNIYPCRLVGRAVVKCAFPYAPKKVAAFPAQDTPLLIEELRDVYACVPARNVLEATLNSPNVSIHLAGSLLNTGAIEHDPDFKLYQQGLTPAVLRCIGQVEDEKALVMEKLGLECVRHLGMMQNVCDYGAHPELADFRLVAGPSSMQHRYIEEDASTGQCILITLAHMLGLRLPAMEALVTLAGVINGKDYLSVGRTVQSLGMDGMTPDQINAYLENGAR